MENVQNMSLNANLYSKSLRGRDHLKDVNVDEKIILNGF
jgi:hypothetical protein